MDAKLSFIAKQISAGKCLVILGPRLLTEDGPNINAKLNAYLTEHLGDMVNYYTADGFLNFDPDDRDLMISEVIADFYKALTPNKVYENIAEIPFSLIINTSPDKTLNSVFDKKNRAYDYDYFKMDEGPDAPPNEHSTLIYNIFGDYEDMDSMVLTFKDLSKYMHSFMNAEPKIKLALNKAKAILFFGFSYDKWYFQLLLSMLRLEKKMKNSWEIPEDNVKNFYVGEFKMKFFSDNTAAKIIDDLHKATIDGLIKPPEKEAAAPAEVYISYSWDGESEDFADLIEETFKKNNIHLIRDKTEMKVKDRISEFMKRIGKADSVVVIIDDKYLKSGYCMFELLEIYNNKNFEKRIHTIILDDAKIFDAEDRYVYKQYWDSEIKKIDAKIDGGEAAESLMSKYKLSKQIHDSWDKIGSILEDMISISPEKQKETNFEDMIKEIKN